jgi:septal ring factor EnvC (AmiA/AmiB activator)
METATITEQATRKDELAALIAAIDSERQASTERLRQWEGKAAEAEEAITKLTAQLADIYSRFVAGESPDVPASLETRLTNLHRTKIGAGQLIADEQARISELEAKRRPLAEERGKL